MKKLGLIINPIAGMGGSVGLKGTDHVVEEAIRRGAQPRAGERVKAALTKRIEIRDQITVYTYPGDMGGELAKSLDFPTVLLTAAGTDAVDADSGYTAAGHTDAADTIELAKKLLEEMLLQNEHILKEEDWKVFVDSLGDSAVILGIRAWVKTEEYWQTRWDLLEEIKLTFDKEGIEIPYNQMTVHVKNGQE